MDLIRSLNQKLKDIQSKYPIEYLQLMQKYEINTLYSPSEDIFLIKDRLLSRGVVINGVRFGSTKTHYSVKDSLQNFHYSIANHSDKCWFAVPDYDMHPDIYLMIGIFKELHLCTITKSINNYIHFNFIESKLCPK